MKSFRYLFSILLIVCIFSLFVIPTSTFASTKISKSKAKKIAKTHIATHENLLIPEGKPSRVNVVRGEILFNPSTREYTESDMKEPNDMGSGHEKKKTWLVTITYEPSEQQTDIYRMHVDATSGIVTNYTVEIR